MSYIHQPQLTVSQRRSTSPTHLLMLTKHHTPQVTQHDITRQTLLLNNTPIANLRCVSPLQSHPPLTVKAAIVSSGDINTYGTISRPMFASSSPNIPSTTPAGYLHATSGHFKGRPLARVINNGKAAAAAGYWHWDSGRHCLFLRRGIG